MYTLLVVLVGLIACTVVDYTDFEARAVGTWLEEDSPIVVEGGPFEDVLPFASIAWDALVPKSVFDGSLVRDVEVLGLDDHEDARLGLGGA